MQKAPSPSGSPGLQQDPALPMPTTPSEEAPSEGHEPRHNHSSAKQVMEEEFQFLRCQGCQAQAKCPKLLPCLHTLCSGCLDAPGLQCPICQAPRTDGGDSQALDNVFFESLQRRLSVYQQIMNAVALCTRCKEPSDFWCFECEQLLCVKCFEAHQWFLKHEARPLADLRGHSVREFLDSTRKSNIFCSNPNHRTPMLTNIYCRGCAKPLCCTCALLDRGHNDLQCDIGAEIQQRQEELVTMTQALQEQDGTFDRAHTEMRSAIDQLGHARTSTEELIRARVQQVVAHVQEQERKLLEAVNARYQRDYDEMATQLDRLDAVLQRIRTGGTLVKRMKLYASDQEVLDMHDFLRKALCRLGQEEPQNLQVPVHTGSFEEFKVRLQELVSCITQKTDAAVPRKASPEVVNALQDLELPSEVQKAEAQTFELAETQPMTVVRSVPGAHPVPVYAFSIKGPTYQEEACQTTTSVKRKCCHPECSRKIIKMESEEEKEARLATSSPEQPRPSTSRAVSPPPVDGPSSSPEIPIIEKEIIPPNGNHVTSDTKETEECVVVISSSEDSDAENLMKSSSALAELLEAGGEAQWKRQPAVVMTDRGKEACGQHLVQPESMVSVNAQITKSSRELDDNSSESSDLHLEGPSSLKVLDHSLDDPQAEDRPLVFFDLKIDNETQKISQLAAVNQESKFRVLIQPDTFSVYSKAVSLEMGLQHFLDFLTNMRRPILACYKLWGPGLPTFFRALDDINKLWEFREAISGFLAALPFIRERVPGASSFKLKNLAKTYLARNMSERSALAAVLAMRDLCRLLEVSPGPQLAQHIYPFSNLQCFASLQPLVQAGVLPRAAARLLALHSVSFLELLTAYRSNPQQGLRKYGHYLSLQTTSSSAAQPAQYLRALSTYLGRLLEGPALTLAGSSSSLAVRGLTKKHPPAELKGGEA